MKNNDRARFYTFFIVSILLTVVINLVFNIFNLNYFLTTLKSYEAVDVRSDYKNIVFLGDSITEGYDLEKFFPDTDSVIINSGVSGNTTEDILKHLKKRAAQYKPSKVFLLIGTNDIGFGYKDEKTIVNIKKIIRELHDKCEGVEIYVESIYPVNTKMKKSKAGDRDNEAVEYINEEIEKYASNNDLVYIDLYSKLVDEDGNLSKEYTTDGLHLSEEGYEVVTSILEEYVK